MKPLLDKYKGSFVGLAIGDTLGMAVEFKSRGEFTPLTEPIAGGPFNLPLGYWTDDTSMALCLADSLLEENGYNSYDVMDRYLAWRVEGYRSSTGKCFDIGNQVSTSLNNYMRDDGAIVHKDIKRIWDSGNGSIMRLAPVVIASHASSNSLEETMEIARISARETHYSFEAEAGTAVFAALIYNTYTATSKEEVFVYGDFPRNDEFNKILKSVESAKNQDESSLNPSGYIVDSLVVAIWAFMHFDSFSEGALAVVNLGGDADTIGAIYGQVAGAYYGYEEIPKSWREKLYQEKMFVELAVNLGGMRTCKILRTRFEEDGANFSLDDRDLEIKS